MLKKVYFATSNRQKVNNAATALRRYGLDVVQIEIDLIESRAEDPVLIALEKAQQAYEQCKKPVLVEDSGFFIHALGGFPMTHIKFSLKTIGIANIMKMMHEVSDRRAEWRMTLAYVWGKGKHQTFTFIEKGTIAKEIRPVKRAMMSDYWRIYIPKLKKSKALALSEMTDEELQAWEKYYATHNQFQMFGRWFDSHKTSTHTGVPISHTQTLK